ncbi:MAG: trypsin-like peptidase domain-containing protein [Bdellovibrionota bacterium]
MKAVRKLSLTLLIMFSLLVLFPNASFAKEGFTTGKDIPSHILDLQDSVFLVHIQQITKMTEKDDAYTLKTETTSDGTAFIIGEDQTFFYFGTANHNIEALNCQKICSGLSLFQKARLRPSIHYFNNKAVPFGHELFLEKGTISFDQVELLKSTKNQDLAIIRAYKRQDIKYALKSFAFSKFFPKKADKLYTIGFPNLSLRKCNKDLKKNTGILFSKNVEKRWSEGFYVDIYSSDNKRDSNTEYWLGTTIDAVPGNSGGPVLNVNGEVVGLMVRSLNGGECYSGIESSENFRPQSFATPWTHKQK